MTENEIREKNRKTSLGTLLDLDRVVVGRET